jgi:hypothetical protein
VKNEVSEPEAIARNACYFAHNRDFIRPRIRRRKNIANTSGGTSPPFMPTTQSTWA